MSRLRGYQQQIVDGCYRAWGRGARVVMPVCATGSGKTVMMSSIARDYPDHGIAMAHRSSLVGQIANALCQEGVQHDIVADKAVIRTIVQDQIEEHGRSFYNPNAKWKVASVDTVLRRSFGAFNHLCGLGFIDEGHHVLRENKWGRAFDMFPNARWLTPSATPDRADGKGLGSHASGVVDEMVEGPPMRWLIDNGYLTDYVYRGATASDLDMSDVEVTASGDYNEAQATRAVKRSKKIIGDVVEQYCKWTPGKLGIVFDVDVEHATKMTQAFNDAGVPAALVHGGMSEEERRPIMRKYKNREYLVLVNVDLFGEGFDLPAIEVVMFARPTMSYSLYAQQWGRALRLMISRILMAAWDSYTPEQRKQHIAESAKPVAYIHDHVGNLLHFLGPPDRPRTWSLDDRPRRSKGASDAIPLRICTNEMCMQPYERSETCCPYCGLEPAPPAERSRPEHVDGDLTLYTPEMLREMFGCNTVEAVQNKINYPQLVIPHGATPAIAGRLQRVFNERCTSQNELRQVMQLVMPPVHDERVNNKRFFLKYGVDTLKAKLLNSADADKLRDRILESIKT